jgi:hypothetical protein
LQAETPCPHVPLRANDSILGNLQQPTATTNHNQIMSYLTQFTCINIPDCARVVMNTCCSNILSEDGLLRDTALLSSFVREKGLARESASLLCSSFLSDTTLGQGTFTHRRTRAVTALTAPTCMAPNAPNIRCLSIDVVNFELTCMACRHFSRHRLDVQTHERQMSRET